MSSVNMNYVCIQLSAMGVSVGPVNFMYTRKDVILYALGGMLLYDLHAFIFVDYSKYEMSANYRPLSIPNCAAKQITT